MDEKSFHLGFLPSTGWGLLVEDMMMVGKEGKEKKVQKQVPKVWGTRTTAVL